MLHLKIFKAVSSTAKKSNINWYIQILNSCDRIALSLKLNPIIHCRERSKNWAIETNSCTCVYFGSSWSVPRDMVFYILLTCYKHPIYCRRAEKVMPFIPKRWRLDENCVHKHNLLILQYLHNKEVHSFLTRKIGFRVNDMTTLMIMLITVIELTFVHRGRCSAVVFVRWWTFPNRGEAQPQTVARPHPRPHLLQRTPHHPSQRPPCRRYQHPRHPVNLLPANL